MCEDKAEQEALAELLAMTPAELDLVQYDKVKIICAAKRCNRGTHARDYGILPRYYHPKMKPMWFDENDSFFLCARHWKFYQRLIKNYDILKVQDRLLDYEKTKIIKLK